MEKRTEIIFQELFSAQVSAFPVSTELDEDQDRWSQRFFFWGSENFKDFVDDGAWQQRTATWLEGSRSFPEWNRPQALNLKIRIYL